MTDERIRDRIDWVHGGLLNWLNSIQGTTYRNSAPSVGLPNRIEHHWIVLGQQMWERAELTLHQNAPLVPNWTNVREFQRDIMAWVKVWQDCLYVLPESRHPVRMSELLDSLIGQLHSFLGNVEVYVQDPNDLLIHIWVRLKNYPDSYACMISLPKLSANAF